MGRNVGGSGMPTTKSFDIEPPQRLSVGAPVRPTPVRCFRQKRNFERPADDQNPRNSLLRPLRILSEHQLPSRGLLVSAPALAARLTLS